MAVPEDVRPQLHEQVLAEHPPEVRVRRAAAVHVRELRAHVQDEAPSEEPREELRERVARVRLPVLRQAVPAEGQSENARRLRAQSRNVEAPQG